MGGGAGERSGVRGGACVQVKAVVQVLARAMRCSVLTPRVLQQRGARRSDQGSIPPSHPASPARRWRALTRGFARRPGVGQRRQVRGQGAGAQVQTDPARGCCNVGFWHLTPRACAAREAVLCLKFRDGLLCVRARAAPSRSARSPRLMSACEMHVLATCEGVRYPRTLCAEQRCLWCCAAVCRCEVCGG